MGQNNFDLMGFLAPPPKDEQKTKRKGLPYIELIIECGPEEEGEFHPVLITGKAAEIVFEMLKKKPNGFIVIARGSFKSYKRKTLPVIHYIEPYEPSQWLLNRAGLL